MEDPEKIWRAAAKDIDSVLKADLVAACAKLGLSTTGNKPDLFERLDEFVSKKKKRPPTGPSNASGIMLVSPTEIWRKASVNIDTVLKVDLVAACATLGLPTTGNKPDLFERLDEVVSKKKKQPAAGPSNVDGVAVPSPMETWRKASVNIDSVLKVDLVAACATLGLPTTDNKPDLFGRLDKHFSTKRNAADDAGNGVVIATNSNDVTRAVAWAAANRERVLTLLFSAKWCPHCPRAQATFVKIAQKRAGTAARFMVVYEDTCRSSVDDFEVRGFPSCVRVTGGDFESVSLSELDGEKALPRKSAAVRKAAADYHYEFIKCDVGLREANVNTQAVAVWESRGDRDAYSGARRAVVSSQSPEVDHVMEVQVVNVAWCSSLKAAPPAANTRSAAKDRIQKFINGVPNLNVTTHAINQSKKGPFTRFLKLVVSDGDHPWNYGNEESMEDLARSGAPSVRRLVDDGVWANIEKEILASHDAVIENVARTRNELGTHGQLFAEHLSELVEKMRLNG